MLDYNSEVKRALATLGAYYKPRLVPLGGTAYQYLTRDTQGLLVWATGSGGGTPGADGKSAYQLWLDLGNTGTPAEYQASLKGPKGDKGEPGSGGTGGGSTIISRAVQSVVSQGQNTLWKNRFLKDSALRDVPTVTSIGAVEGDKTRAYPATGNAAKPWNILGGLSTLDGWGIRGINTTLNSTTKFSHLYTVDFILDGDELNFLLEQTPANWPTDRKNPIRILIEEDGFMKYLPDAQFPIVKGTGQQHYKVVFANPQGVRRRRHIQIECGACIALGDVNNAPRFGGAWVKPADQVTRASKPLLRSVAIGDSNIMGVNGPPGASHSCVMAASIGLHDHWVSPIHTTGELQTNINGFRWSQRRNDWRDCAPNLVTFNLSWVDRQVVKNGEVPLATAVTRLMAEFKQVRIDLPNAVVAVFPLLWTNEEYLANPDIMAFNNAVKDAIVANDDPFILYVADPSPESSMTNGNSSLYFGQDGHYSALGDEYCGIVEAQTVLDLFNNLLMNVEDTPVDPVASISPSSLSISGVAGSTAAGDLALVLNATASGIASVTPVVPGVTFSMVGNVLRAAGNYPTAGSYNTVIQVATDKGNLAFSLAATSTPVGPVLSINPTSPTISVPAAELQNVLLTTVSGGTPSGVTGALPAGLAYTVSGQEIRLTGTASAAAAASARAGVIATSNGSITMNWNLTVTAAVSEAQAYAARVASVSTPLSGATITAVENWVAALKTANVWNSIKDCGLMLGADLAAARVKIKFPTGAPSTMAQTGMTNANYQFGEGAGWYAANENDNQSLDTVSTVAQLGISGTNLSMGLMRMDYRDEARPWFSVIVPTGTAEAPAYITDYNSGTPDKVAVTGNGPSLRVVSVTADAKALVVENGAVVQDFSGANGGTVTPLDAVGHFSMFKSRRGGNDFYGTLRAGFYFVGTALTKAQAIALSRATRQLYKALGRLNTKADTAYVGDSITAGFFVNDPNNRWSTISAVATNRWETNFGVPSSSIRVVNSDAQPLINRYLDIIAEAPEAYSVLMGTNDILTDGNPNGDAATIADCKAKYTTILTAFKNTGKPVRVNGFPYTAQVSLAKATAYEVAFADVCRTLDIPYVSQYLCMTDTGDAAGLLGGDGVHPNEAGMAFIAAGDVEMTTAKTTRSVTLDFPSIAAGANQDLNVTMYRAAAGASVAVALPAGYPAGLTATAVATAANTVRIRVTNSTGAAIDPPSGKFVVTLNFTPPAASIFPSSAGLNSTVGQFRNGLILGEILNGTPTGIVSGNLPPAGMTFGLSGPNLTLTGTYTTAGSTDQNVTVGTTNGNVVFNLKDTVVAAAAPVIAPTSRTVNLVVGTPVNQLLGTVTGGIPNQVTGSVPAGCAYEMDGQDIRLTGTPTTVAASTVFNPVVRCTVGAGNQNVNFALTAVVTAAGGSMVTLADLKFEGTQGTKTITNDATGPGALSFTVPSGNTQLSTGAGVKQGLRALMRTDPEYAEPGALSVEDVTFDGELFLGGWFMHNGNGCLFSMGAYSGSSYLDIEINGDKIEVYTTESTGSQGLLIQATAPAPNTLFYASVSRNAANRLSLGVGGTEIGFLANVTSVFTGKLAILNQPDNGYGLQGGWADLVKVNKGPGAGVTFPYTPPTT